MRTIGELYDMIRLEEISELHKSYKKKASKYFWFLHSFSCEHTSTKNVYMMGSSIC